MWVDVIHDAAWALLTGREQHSQLKLCVYLQIASCLLPLATANFQAAPFAQIRHCRDQEDRLIYCGLAGGWAAQIFSHGLGGRFMMYKRGSFFKKNPKNPKASGPNSWYSEKNPEVGHVEHQDSRDFCSSATVGWAPQGDAVHSIPTRDGRNEVPPSNQGSNQAKLVSRKDSLQKCWETMSETSRAWRRQKGWSCQHPVLAHSMLAARH